MQADQKNNIIPFCHYFYVLCILFLRGKMVFAKIDNILMHNHVDTSVVVNNTLKNYL